MKQSQKWPIALFTIGVFMAGLDNGIISAALTTIYSSFGVTPAWGAWTVTLYTLGIAISVPVIGKLSDNFGRKRLFIIEIFLFGLGSLLVALSPNFAFLLVARFIQAIGGGGIFIIGSSHVLATLPKHQQGKVLGLLGGMHGISAVIGPNLGGVILHMTDTWQWMFLINIPIVIFLLIVGFFKIEETKSPTNKRLDLTGSIMLSTAIVVLMLGLTNLNSLDLLNSLLSIHAGPFIVTGIILLIIFLNYERKLEKSGGDPIIPSQVLKSQNFRMTLLLGFLSGGFLSCIIFIPSFAQQVLLVPAENAGFWLTPLAIASGVGAGLGGFLTDRIGSIRTIIVAGVIGFSGFLTFYLYVNDFPTFLIASVLSGVGLGFLLGAPLNVLISEDVKQSQYGSSLGTLSLVRQIGLTIFPTIFASFITGGVLKIKPTIKPVFLNSDITFEELNIADDYGEIMAFIAQMEDPYMKSQLLSLVGDAMRSGFNQMFLLALVIAIIVVIMALNLLFLKNDQR